MAQEDSEAVAEPKKRHKPYTGLNDMFNMKNCPVCGKEYIVSCQEWVYKKTYDGKLHYFCSYNCMRKRLKEKGLD